MLTSIRNLRLYLHYSATFSCCQEVFYCTLQLLVVIFL
nr:MAG TPA: hypothetical protein [Caudoviricetes sp.]